MKRLRILYSDEAMVAIQKPAGMHVHPPEDPRHRIPSEESCLRVLSRQLTRYLYPVHRLDRPTSGVLLFALNPESASHLNRQFEERRVRKLYVTLTRGWLKPHEQLLDRPLTDSGPSQTWIQTLGRWEAPWGNLRHPRSRYTLALAEPRTGRMHQIRRHLAGIGHPVIGDTQRGDGEHNRLFREHWQVQRLWLHALNLTIDHPLTGERLRIRSPFPSDWHQAFDAFGVCPTGWLGPSNE